MVNQCGHKGLHFGPQPRKSGMKRHKPKSLMKQVLKEVHLSRLAYMLPANNANRKGYGAKPKAKIGNEKLQRTSMIKSACTSNHVLAPTLRDKMQSRMTKQPNTLNRKEGFHSSSLERSKLIHPKPKHSVNNGGTSKQSPTCQGGILLEKDNIVEELKSLKDKNVSMSKGLNLSMEKVLLVPNKGNLNDESNKFDTKYKDKVMIDEDKKIQNHIILGSTKSSARHYVPQSHDDHYMDITKGSEVLNTNPLIKQKTKGHDSIDCEDPRPVKKRRRYVVECDDEDEANHGDQNPIDLNNPTNTMPIDSESIKSGFYNNSHPIDEPIWSGILKIGSQDYIPLSAHLSTKSCKKVWDLSSSMAHIVQVTKLSRAEVWPKRLDASKLTDNIGLYFFHHKMRPDKGTDQLVKEIVENDMALRGVVGEAQMLLFPSTLLPEQYQTFQGKHYLWGAFKSKQDEQEAAVAAEQQHGSEHRCKQEEEEITNESSLQDTPPARKQATRMGRKKKQHQLPPPPAVDNDTHGGGGVDDVEQRTGMDQPSRTADGDEAVAAPANRHDHHHGRVVGLVFRQTPRLEELIREMRREGALVATMEGEMMMGSGIGATTTLG